MPGYPFLMYLTVIIPGLTIRIQYNYSLNWCPLFDYTNNLLQPPKWELMHDEVCEPKPRAVFRRDSDCLPVALNVNSSAADDVYVVDVKQDRVDEHSSVSEVKAQDQLPDRRWPVHLVALQPIREAAIPTSTTRCQRHPVERTCIHLRQGRARTTGLGSRSDASMTPTASCPKQTPLDTARRVYEDSFH
jgi:hypothetical protein